MSESKNTADDTPIRWSKHEPTRRWAEKRQAGIDAAVVRLDTRYNAAMAVANVLYVFAEAERGEVDAAAHLLDVDTLPELARHLSSLIDDMHAAGCEIARATSDGANHG